MVALPPAKCPARNLFATVGACTGSSTFNGSTADGARLELPAIPACDGNEEKGELFELSHPGPLRGVVAAQTGADLSSAKTLLLGAEAEKEEHDTSVEKRIYYGSTQHLDAPRHLQRRDAHLHLNE
jgi:hypothetical protein